MNCWVINYLFVYSKCFRMCFYFSFWMLNTVWWSNAKCCNFALKCTDRDDDQGERRFHCYACEAHYKSSLLLSVCLPFSFLNQYLYKYLFPRDEDKALPCSLLEAVPVSHDSRVRTVAFRKSLQGKRSWTIYLFLPKKCPFALPHGPCYMHSSHSLKIRAHFNKRTH